MGFRAGDRAVYQSSEDDNDPVNGMTVTIEGPSDDDFWGRESYAVWFEPTLHGDEWQDEGVAFLEELTLVEATSDESLVWAGALV